MAKKHYLYFMVACALLGSLCACKHKNTEGDGQDIPTADSLSTEIYVDTLRLKEQTFHRQLVCNGKLRALEKCDLSLADGGSVDQVFVPSAKFKLPDVMTTSPALICVSFRLHPPIA
jgi:hypothetical protein